MIFWHYLKMFRRRLLLRITAILLLLYFVHTVYQFYTRKTQGSYFGNDKFYQPLERGVHIVNKYKYLPDVNGMFTCLKDRIMIKYEYVNDDYCDCSDGTDEPGTNACPNGVFFCTNSAHSRAKPIPSGKVNDGICDCCDGSDEWNSIPLTAMLNKFNSYEQQESRPFCKNTCK